MKCTCKTALGKRCKREAKVGKKCTQHASISKTSKRVSKSPSKRVSRVSHKSITMLQFLEQATMDHYIVVKLGKDSFSFYREDFPKQVYADVPYDVSKMGINAIRALLLACGVNINSNSEAKLVAITKRFIEDLASNSGYYEADELEKNIRSMAAKRDTRVSRKSTSKKASRKATSRKMKNTPRIASKRQMQKLIVPRTNQYNLGGVEAGLELFLFPFQRIARTTGGALPHRVTQRDISRNIEKIDVGTLRQFAKEAGVKGSDKMRKAELVALVRDILVFE
jgi:hypothetical protein